MRYLCFSVKSKSEKNSKIRGEEVIEELKLIRKGLDEFIEKMDRYILSRNISLPNVLFSSDNASHKAGWKNNCVFFLFNKQTVTN